MLAKEPFFYTPEEYLALEEQAETKNEYHQGEIIAMSGASINHNRLTRNLTTILTNAFENKICEAFSGDLCLWIADKQFYTYPDLLVICGQPEFVKNRTDTVTNPDIIFEVLSKSTESYDRGRKFHAYWTLNTLQEYILVDQYSVRVEYFRRVDKKLWELQVLTKLSEVLTLNSSGVLLPLDKIYRNIEFNE